MNRISAFVMFTVILGLWSGPPSAMAQVLQTSEGEVKSVDTEARIFVIAVDDEDIQFGVDDDTRYTLDGLVAEMDDALRPGNYIIVTHSDTTATKIDAFTPEDESDFLPEERDETWE